MEAPLVAVISFFALGANLLGGSLLLLFSPRNRDVRWFSLFQLAIIWWLLAQGVMAAWGATRLWAAIYSTAVTLLPGLFVASALLDDPNRPVRYSLYAAAAAVLMVPVGLAQMLDLFTVPAGDIIYYWIWHAGGWTFGSIALFRSNRRRRSDRPPLLDRTLVVTLMLVAPIAVALALVLGAGAFFRYAMPLVTVGIQLMIFVGVTRMRFYDIEIRASRSGELAVRAAETERLAVLGELAAAVAHEVRNPLTGVRSLAQQIAEDDLEEERRRRYADVILQEIGRVERIVSNLLGVSRRSERGGWRDETTALDGLFDDLVLLTASPARKAGVTVVADARGSTVSAPREPLAQTILNLLLNAIEHAPGGGTIELLAREEGEATAVLVRDDGPGIPVAERERIFEPFRTTGDGTGLGLSVVRRTCRELGWTVTIGDAPGNGAEFRVEIPTANPKVEEEVEP